MKRFNNRIKVCGALGSRTASLVNIFASLDGETSSRVNIYDSRVNILSPRVNIFDPRGNILRPRVIIFTPRVSKNGSRGSRNASLASAKYFMRFYSFVTWVFDGFLNEILN